MVGRMLMLDRAPTGTQPGPRVGNGVTERLTPQSGVVFLIRVHRPDCRQGTPQGDLEEHGMPGVGVWRAAAVSAGAAGAGWALPMSTQLMPTYRTFRRRYFSAIT